MSTASQFPKTTAGKHFFVSGLSAGREVFVGRAIDEPYEEHLTLEGRVVSAAASGMLVARPFNTTVNFFLLDSSFTVHHIVHSEVQDEVQRLLELSITTLSRSSFPFVHRWIEAAFQFDDFAGTQTRSSNRFAAPSGLGHHSSPFHGFYEGFHATAEQFRRVLFHSRQVNTSRELDKVIELEGDLTIEVGKVVNQVGIRFNQIVQREAELAQHIEAFHGSNFPPVTNQHLMSGWIYLVNRLHFAKNFARRFGKAPLVREINTLIKDGIFGINEVLLEHCNSLDTLVSEAFSQYGISYEVHGELSAFSGFTGPIGVTVEGQEHVVPLTGSVPAGTH